MDRGSTVHFCAQIAKHLFKVKNKHTRTKSMDVVLLSYCWFSTGNFLQCAKSECGNISNRKAGIRQLWEKVKWLQPWNYNMNRITC